MRFSFKIMPLLVAGIAMQAPAHADDSPLVKAAPKDKPICKTETVVGSLIPGPRRCHTRAEWEQHAVAGQAIGRKLVEDGMGRPSSN